jgi:2-phosphosulfolactate phosphatase
VRHEGITLGGWSLPGVLALREHVAVLVIVDVLSFSTAVDIAVSRGACVLPVLPGPDDELRAVAEEAGALLAAPRHNRTGFTLSPQSLTRIPPGTRLMLPSPNGARLSLAGGSTPTLTGCLRNARAVARAARHLARGGSVGVIPAGERWSDESLRPAIEDLIGAGAIIDALGMPLSSEARVMRDAFHASAATIASLLRSSCSGQELIARGFREDVELALAYNVSDTAPLLINGAFGRCEFLEGAC